MGQDDRVKAKPFPTLIEWLVSQKEIWERVAAVDAAKKGALAMTHFTGDALPSSDSEKKCFKCGERGHVRASCPKRATILLLRRRRSAPNIRSSGVRSTKMTVPNIVHQSIVKISARLMQLLRYSFSRGIKIVCTVVVTMIRLVAI